MQPVLARKVAAAVAAVFQYVAETEAAAVATAPVPVPPDIPAPGVWSLAGRQEGMFLRNLWQRRLTKSW